MPHIEQCMTSPTEKTPDSDDQDKQTGPVDSSASYKAAYILKNKEESGLPQVAVDHISSIAGN